MSFTEKTILLQKQTSTPSHQIASIDQQNYGTSDEAVATFDVDNTEETEEVQNKPCHIKVWDWMCYLYTAQSFLIGVISAILIAKVYPPLGAIYLHPQITANWIVVMFIFTLTGLGLKSEELGKAFTRLRFNSFVQIFNFGVVSAFVFGFTRLALALGVLSEDLAKGMVICACLPLSVNMVCVLTVSASGDEAAAIFNVAFSNLVGVFLSPVLILGYLGVTGDVDLVSTFVKLAIRIVLPIIIAQISRKLSKSVAKFAHKYKKRFSKLQEWSLIFIVYTVFCKTFMEDSVSSVGGIFLMIFYQFICLSVLKIIAWFGLKLLFPKEPRLRVMGLFGCTQKTVAMGIPLIGAMYDNSPNVGLYTLPLLIWHPMQLVIGSALVPKLKAFVTNETVLGYDSIAVAKEENKSGSVTALSCD